MAAAEEIAAASSDALGTMDGLRSEQPEHVVILDDFLIAKCELSQAVWDRFMAVNKSSIKGELLPVENCTWYEAAEFCSKTGLELPSEAQWEYACRGPTGYTYSGGMSLSIQDANFLRVGVDVPSDLASCDSFPENGFGLYNMHGNVSEWCLDEFSSLTYVNTPDHSRNPLCTCNETDESYGVTRGGDRYRDMYACRATARTLRDRLLDTQACGVRPVYMLSDITIEVCGFTGKAPSLRQFVAEPSTYGFSRLESGAHVTMFKHRGTGLSMILSYGDLMSGLEEKATKPYLVSVNCVPNFMWEAKMGGRLPVIGGLDEVRPERVSWNMAAGFAAKYGLTLPSSAQVEAALEAGMLRLSAGFEWCRDGYTAYRNQERWYDYVSGERRELRVMLLGKYRGGADLRGTVVAKQFVAGEGPSACSFRLAFEFANE